MSEQDNFEDDILGEQLETLFHQADSALLKEKDFVKAEEIYNQVLKLEGDNVSAMNGLVYCLENEQRFDEALQILQRAFLIDGEDHETNFNMGLHLMDHTNNFDLAIKFFDQALQSAHDDNQKVKSIFNKAKCLEQKDDYELAINEYEKVLELDKFDHKALVNLAVAKEKIGKSDEAMKDLERAIVAGETNRKIYTNLAIILRKKGQYDESEAQLEKALNLANDQDLDTSGEDSQSEMVVSGNNMIGTLRKIKYKDLIYYNRALLSKERGSNIETQKLLIEESFQEVTKNPKSQCRIKLAELCEQAGMLDLAGQLYSLNNSLQNDIDKDNDHQQRQQQKQEENVNNIEDQDSLQVTTGMHKSNTFLQRMSTKRTQVLEDDIDDNTLVRNKTFSVARQKTSSNNKKRVSNVAQRPKSKSTIKEEEDEERKSDDCDNSNDDFKIDEEEEGSSSQEGEGLKTDEDIDHLEVVEREMEQLDVSKDDLLDNKKDEEEQKQKEDEVVNSDQQQNDIQVVVIKILDHENDEHLTVDDGKVKLFRDECLTTKSNVIEKKKSSGSLRYSNLVQGEQNEEEPEGKANADDLMLLDNECLSEEDKENCDYEEWTQTICEEKLKNENINLYAMLRLAQIHIDSEKDKLAFDLLRKIKSVHSDFKKAEITSLLIEVSENLGQVQQQIGLYNELIQYHQQRCYQPNSNRKLQEAIFNKGKTHERLKDYESALEMYLESAKLPNASHKMYLRAAQCYKKLGNFVKAAENLEIAIEKEKKAADPRESMYLIDHMLNLCVIYYHNLKDYDKAINFAKQITEKDGSNGNALLILGRINDKRDRNEDAIKYYEQSTELDQYALEGNFRLGNIYEKIGNQKKAIYHLKQALGIKKTHLESLLALANILLKKKEYERSLKYFKHALLFQPDDVEALYGYSMSLFKNQLNQNEGKTNSRTSINQSSMQGFKNSEMFTPSFELDQLIKYLTKLLMINPSYYQAYRLLGEIYLAVKDYDKAVDNLKKSLQIKTKDSDSLMLLGRVLQETGNFETAVKYFKTALKHNGDNIQAMIYLGNVTYDQGKYQEAAKYYETVLSVDDKLCEVHYDLGNAYYNLEQVENAILHYKKATNLNPNKVEYYYNLGNALALYQNYELAILEYDNALKLDSSNPAIFFNKGNSHFFIKQYKEAIEQYLKSLELNQDQVDCLFNLANSFQELKDYDNAIHYYREVITKDAKSEGAYMNLALIYQVNQKKHQKAYEIYQKMLHIFPNNLKVKAELQKFRVDQ